LLYVFGVGVGSSFGVGVGSSFGVGVGSSFGVGVGAGVPHRYLIWERPGQPVPVLVMTRLLPALSSPVMV
jgi:hypothetical protein